MSRIIYHGSGRIVKKPGFGVGSAYNDFGLGFYCCDNPDPAAEWATRGGNGFISSYSLDTDGLRIVNLCSQQFTILHWIGVLLGFREFDTSAHPAHQAREYIAKHFAVDIQGCDCIIGYRADNSCFKLTQDFISGRLSYNSLRNALIGSAENRQVVLKSNRAFDRLTFTGYEPALYSEYQPGFSARELAILRKAASAANDKDLFIEQLIDEEVKPYDPRLR